MGGADPTPLPGPGRFIPVNDLRALRASPLGALLRLAQQYGDLFRYPVGFWTIHVVNHPDYVRHILLDNSRNYSKDTFQYNLLGAVAGEGLLTNHGESWLQQRRLAQPAFHRERLAGLGAGMVAETARLVDAWAPHAARGETIDVDAAMMELTLSIVGRSLFSASMQEEAGELARAVLVALDHVIYRARSPFALPSRLPTPRNRRYRAALQRLDGAVYGLIARRRAAGGSGPADLLSMLMEAQDAESGARMSDRQLRDELVTLIVAGHETVASALTWSWHLLATHPAAARRMEEELDGVLGERMPTVADLPRLRYTRAVFDESLRLFPPAWIMTRRAIAADRIGPYEIPAGALMVLSPYMTHRHPTFWEHPERFEPERFLDARGSERPRFAYFPFGGGPHLCVGNHFALIEATLVLATIARCYRLSLRPGGVPVEVEPLVTLRPRHGLWMRVDRRRADT